MPFLKHLRHSQVAMFFLSVTALNYGMYRHGRIRLELFDKLSQDLHNPCIWYGDLWKLAINLLRPQRYCGINAKKMTGMVIHPRTNLAQCSLTSLNREELLVQAIRTVHL